MGLLLTLLVAFIACAMAITWLLLPLEGEEIRHRSKPRNGFSRKGVKTTKQ
jgi:hypothetical protein